ncbi:MAG: acetolactate synthase small subunit [Rickettsiales bacterium]|jgi:acetolactate synthase-1/3 small subunit|nr:acetolactate synthase small subunit [Rickettsiales bacterium]
MEKEIEKSLVTILIPNIKGQLAKISVFCAENNLNISRLTLSAADGNDKIQKIIAYLEGDRKNVNDMCKKILEIDTVLKVTNFQTNGEYIEKEICFIKILNKNSKLPMITNIVSDHSGKTIFGNNKITVFRIEDSEENVNAFVSKAIDITKDIEIARSGMVAIAINESIDSIIDVDL